MRWCSVQAGDLAAYTELLERLVAHAAADAADRKGWRPLHVACDAGNYTAVSALLAHDSAAVAAATVRRSRSHTILLFASLFGLLFCFSFLFFSVPETLAPAHAKAIRRAQSLGWRPLLATSGGEAAAGRRERGEQQAATRTRGAAATIRASLSRTRR